MAKNAQKMTRKRTRKKKATWPRGKPIPAFGTEAEEAQFWESHRLESGVAADWEELIYEPRATSRPRSHVYRIRLDDKEMAALQALSRRRGVPASVIVRELVRAAFASARRSDDPDTRSEA
jgi:hypothetical protein